VGRKIELDPEYVRFLAAVVAARKARGMNQSQLGALLGKDQSFVSKVEHAERRVDVIEALRWCGALDIALEEVVGPELVKTVRRRKGK
jgi:transcriptional regulator with XRE-family HTH domain